MTSASSNKAWRCRAGGALVLRMPSRICAAPLKTLLCRCCRASSRLISSSASGAGSLVTAAWGELGSAGAGWPGAAAGAALVAAGAAWLVAAWLATAWLVAAWLVAAWLVVAWLATAWLVAAWLVAAWLATAWGAAALSAPLEFVSDTPARPAGARPAIAQQKRK